MSEQRRVDQSSGTSPDPASPDPPGSARQLPAPAVSETSPDPASPDPAIRPASLFRRFGALVIDWLLCVGISLFFVSMTRTGWLPPAILIVEYAFFIGLFTQTPGMRVLGLRCVSFATGGRIGVLRAGLRAALLCLVLPALLMDGAQRGLHDRLTGSIIVRASDRAA